MTANVDENGKVTAVNPGTTTITVTTSNGLSAACDITVKAATPVLLSSVPKNNAVDVNKDSTITLTYNTYLLKGADFESIILTNTTTGQNVEIDRSISGKKLIITPKSPLKGGHIHRLTVPKTGLMNYSNSPLSSSVDITFTTKAMELLSTSPANGSENAVVTGKITAEFDTAIYEGTAFNDIALTNKSTGEREQADIEINGAVLSVIPLAALDYSTQYELVIPKGAVKNSDDSENTKAYSILFNTKDSQPEMIDSYPKSNSVGCFADTEISIYFDMNIFEGNEFKNILLIDTGNKEINGNISIDGSTLKFTPQSLLKNNTKYTLKIPKAAVLNEGNEGNLTDISLAFTTGEVLRGDTALPVISPQSSTVSREEKIILSCDDSNAKIYYTTDGSDPLEEGLLYTQGFSLGFGEKTVRCITVKEGTASAEVLKSYEFYYVVPKDGNVFGGTGGNDYFTAVEPAADGWIVCGYSINDSFSTGAWEDTEAKGDADAFIIKYASDGSIEWKKSFGGNADDYFYGVTVTDDGYIAVGTSWRNSFKTGDWTGVSPVAKYYYENDATVVKFDLDGVVQWKANHNRSGGNGFAEFYDVTATSDGGCIASGYRSGGEVGGCMVLIKYSSTGVKGWTQELTSVCDSVDSNNGLEAVIVDGSYVVAAGEANENLYITKRSAGSGKIVWGRYTSNHKYANERIYDIVKADDGYIIVGYSEESNFGTGTFANIEALGQNDAVILKYDTSGNLLWIRSFGGIGDDSFYGVTAAEGGFVAVGSVHNGDNSDAVAVKYDTDGNILWKKTFSGLGNELFADVIATDDGYVAVGTGEFESFGSNDYADMEGYGFKDGFAVKFDDAVTYTTKGDVNNDGLVDKADGAIVLKYLSDIGSLTYPQKEIADMDTDGIIDLKDVLLILQQ